MVHSDQERAIDAFKSVRPDAVYCGVDHHGTLMVFVVVPEHDDEVYDRFVRAEQDLFSAYPGIRVEARLRAHQGRPHSKAVPLTSEPAYVG